MKTTDNRQQRDFYFSLKQAELFHLLNEDDAHPGFIERKTVFGKVYTCVVDMGKPPTGVFDDYTLVGTGTDNDIQGNGRW